MADPTAPKQPWGPFKPGQSGTRQAGPKGPTTSSLKHASKTCSRIGRPTCQQPLARSERKSQTHTSKSPLRSCRETCRTRSTSGSPSSMPSPTATTVTGHTTLSTNQLSRVSQDLQRRAPQASSHVLNQDILQDDTKRTHCAGMAATISGDSLGDIAWHALPYRICFRTHRWPDA